MTTIPESEMPAPRLELRWKDEEGLRDGYTCVCLYLLVLKLGDHDIRRERHDANEARLPDLTEWTIEVGKTLSTGTAASRYSLHRWGVDQISEPFRDGAHARWDTKQLGNLPIYAVADGRAMLVESREDEQ